MKNAPSRNVDDSTTTVPLVTSGEFDGLTEFHIRFLLLMGVVLVCSADSIVGFFLSKQDYGDSVRDSIIHNFAPGVRLLGLMSFAAGLVERVVFAISKIKL